MTTGTRSISFFDEQFRRAHTGVALALNPFEEMTLPHLQGRVLDFGCGLGNLACAAAARGCRVVALDASPAAVEHLQARAAADGLDIQVERADLRDYPLQGEFDCIVCIGLLMFFECATAERVLAQLEAHVRAGGIVAVNVLVAGTTYLGMFDPAGYCLFDPAALQRRFAGWTVLEEAGHEFAAPENTVKRFVTLIARKPEEPRTTDATAAAASDASAPAA